MKKQIIFSFLICIVLMNNAKAQWSLSGNSGTNPPTSFIGTIDNKDIVFKTFNSERMRILSLNGNIGIGTLTPGHKLQIDNGNLLIRGTNNFSANNDQAILYIGDDKNYIKSVRGKGMVLGTYCWNSPYYVDVININHCGNVGIGTANPGNCKLAVEGTIGAREVRVLTGPFPDFVFADGYKLLTLNEIEMFIKQNKHLPDIPSALDIETSGGVPLGEMQLKLLQKIEEQMLYIIDLQKQIDEMKILLNN